MKTLHLAKEDLLVQIETDLLRSLEDEMKKISGIEKFEVHSVEWVESGLILHYEGDSFPEKAEE